MLKFNIKEHELQELEQYGFEKLCTWYCKNLEENTNVEMNLGISTIDYQVQIGYTFSCSQVSVCSFINEQLDVLYELINKGLIIKE